MAAYAAAQQIGHQKSEYHPSMNFYQCQKESGCKVSEKSVTMDANWRWTHNVGGYQNCYEGTSWDKNFCPDPDTCAQGCAIDGVDTNDMKNTYGVTSDGENLTLGFVTRTQYGTNVGSRMYMLQDAYNYEMFKLKNREFSFTVDVSALPCGLNGALYFTEMPQDGDKGMGNNQAGAQYGTGYCDAQCPHDLKFIKGQANTEDWNTTTGMGKFGICCAEMDIWEANKTASAYTVHPCNISEGSFKCQDAETCGDNPDHRYDGLCDKDGCDLNPYRAGVTNFYGEGLNVDTTKPFQVITQFITENNDDESDVVEIKRVYVQNGRKIEHPETKIPGLSQQYDTITDEMCDDVKTAFGDKNDYKKKGGMKGMSDALGRGMVLVMSLWDDHAANMLWLDSRYPTDSQHEGALRGPCSTSSGKPDDVESQSPNAYVKYGSIKVGEIGSTFEVEEVFLQ